MDRCCACTVRILTGSRPSKDCRTCRCLALAQLQPCQDVAQTSRARNGRFGKMERKGGRIWKEIAYSCTVQLRLFVVLRAHGLAHGCLSTLEFLLEVKHWTVQLVKLSVSVYSAQASPVVNSELMPATQPPIERGSLRGLRPCSRTSDRRCCCMTSIRPHRK